MPDLDLGPAIEAAAKAMDVAEYSYMLRGNLNERHIEAILTAALPELRKAIAEEQDVGIIALTMTPDAGATFLAALNHAAARTKDDGHAEWLQWGASRLDAAIVRGQSGGEHA